MRRSVSGHWNSDKKASSALVRLLPRALARYLTMHPPLMYLGKPGVPRTVLTFDWRLGLIWDRLARQGMTSPQEAVISLGRRRRSFRLVRGG